MTWLLLFGFALWSVVAVLAVVAVVVALAEVEEVAAVAAAALAVGVVVVMEVALPLTTPVVEEKRRDEAEV